MSEDQQLREKYERRAFNAASLFIGTIVVQFLIPSPLDSLLLPTAVAYTYMKSDKEIWPLDLLYKKARNVFRDAYDLYVKESSVVGSKVTNSAFSQDDNE